MVQSYRDLLVWQKAMDVADKAFALCEKLPSDQRYVLISQIQRAAVSVPSNIAEGRSRHSNKEFIYFLNIAKGSISELETQIMLAQRRRYIDGQDLECFLVMSEEVTKMLHGLKSSLESGSAIRLAKT